MVLHLGGQDVPLAQMGPDFIILKQALHQTQGPAIPAGQRRASLTEVGLAVAA